MIDDSTAGQATDALIAEQLFGYVWMQVKTGIVVEGNPSPYRFLADPAWVAGLGWYVVAADMAQRIVYQDSTPKYSTDIAAAFAVVMAMEARGYWCQMRTPFMPPQGDGYWAGFTPHATTGWNGTPDHWTSAETLPLAICRAALAALAEATERKAEER